MTFERYYTEQTSVDVLENLLEELNDKIDGGEECQSHDSHISDQIRAVSFAIAILKTAGF